MNTSETNRISPEERKLKLEEKNINEAIKQSLETHQTYEKQRGFETIEGLKECLKTFQVSKFWDVVYRENSICFLNLKFDFSNVSLMYSVQVNEKLELSVSYKGEEIGFLSKFKFPLLIKNINALFNILNEVEGIHRNELKSNPYPCVDLILSMLKNLDTVVEDNKKSCLEFLKEQLTLLFTKPEKYSYSPETLIFSSMFFLLSPSAYKFIRQSGLITLPHPTTINRLSAKFNVNPLNEINDTNFLAYAKHRVITLEKQELYVSLMIDEIHLKECYDYNERNQKQIALQITMNILSTKDISIHTCKNHFNVKVIMFIIQASTNTLLNNYCKTKCDAVSKAKYDAVSKKSNKRKLATYSTSSNPC